VLSSCDPLTASKDAGLLYVQFKNNLIFAFPKDNEDAKMVVVVSREVVMEDRQMTSRNQKE